MDAGRLTRAELAVRTGISKPTVGGERAPARPRPGWSSTPASAPPGAAGSAPTTRWPPTSGTALAVSIAPAGRRRREPRRVRARSWPGPSGRWPARPDPSDVAAALAGALAATSPRPPRGRSGVAVVSAADPVDRAPAAWCTCPTRRSCVGELRPGRASSAPYVDGAGHSSTTTSTGPPAPNAPPAAPPARRLRLRLPRRGPRLRGRQRRRGPPRPRRPRPGRSRTSMTAGPGGRAMRLHRRVRRSWSSPPGSTAVDVDALLAAVSGRGAGSTAVRESSPARSAASWRRPSLWPTRSSS